MALFSLFCGISFARVGFGGGYFGQVLGGSNGSAPLCALSYEHSCSMGVSGWVLVGGQIRVSLGMGWECGDRRHHGKSPKPRLQPLAWVGYPLFLSSCRPGGKVSPRQAPCCCSWNHSALGGFHTPCSFIHSLWSCRPLVWDSRVALWSACLGGQPHLLWLGSPGENYSLSPLIFFPLPPVGWFPWVWWPPGCLSCPFPLLRFLLPFVGFPFALPSRHCWCWLTV